MTATATTTTMMGWTFLISSYFFLSLLSASCADDQLETRKVYVLYTGKLIIESLRAMRLSEPHFVCWLVGLGFL